MKTETDEENQDDDQTRNQEGTIETETGKQWRSQETSKVSNIA